MKRDAQAAVLVIMGAALLRISIGGSYVNYVQTWMRPFLIVAGAVFAILGLLGVAALILSGRTPEQAHDHHAPRVAWLLLLPVLAIFLIAPPALGSYAASRDEGTVAELHDYAYPPLPDGDPASITLSDYAYGAVWDEGKTLKGRSVELTGFVTPREDGGWYLTRIALACCAADGQAIKVQVRDADDQPADAWVDVVGTWAGGGDEIGGEVGGEVLPVLVADEVRRIEAPAEPYE